MASPENQHCATSIGTLSFLIRGSTFNNKTPAHAMPVRSEQSVGVSVCLSVTSRGIVSTRLDVSICLFYVMEAS